MRKFRRVRSRCELAIKYVLPAIRYLVAKELREKHHFTQEKAANALGVTQPAISQYLRSKRGMKWAEKISKDEEMRTLIEELAQHVSMEGVVQDEGILCGVCREITRKLVEGEMRDISRAF